MKNVFIIGSRGYKANYGGWETFVTNLVDNYDDKNTKFYVSELSDKEQNQIVVNKTLVRMSIYIKQEGSIQMFLYAVKSLDYSLDYIEKNNIQGAVIYILGLKLLNYLSLRKNKIKKLGVKIYVNPDGLEWMRSKWGYLAKQFFKLSERFMLKSSDVIVCDSLGIKDYVVEKYPKLKNKTTYIAYGVNDIKITEKNEKDILKEYNLKSNNYCLMVGRCVPENNYELVIKEFMNSNIKKDLVIISNLDSSNYYQEIVNNTNCDNDSRIKFINGVYDQEKLAIIRKNAYLYIHGHSVGGTNPSLIEALSLTDLNLLYDVSFNRYAALNTALYFKKSGSLTKLLNDTKYLDKKRKELGNIAKKRVKENFTWKIIVDQYKELFREV